MEGTARTSSPATRAPVASSGASERTLMIARSTASLSSGCADAELEPNKPPIIPSPRRASAPSARRSDSSAREKALILARVASRRPPGESPRAENRARGPPPRSRRAGRATPRARAPLPRHHGCPRIEPRGDPVENANFFRTNNNAPGLLTRLTLLDVRGDRVGRTTTSPPSPIPSPLISPPSSRRRGGGRHLLLLCQPRPRLRRRLLRERLDPLELHRQRPLP